MSTVGDAAVAERPPGETRDMAGPAVGAPDAFDSSQIASREAFREAFAVFAGQSTSPRLRLAFTAVVVAVAVVTCGSPSTITVTAPVPSTRTPATTSPATASETPGPSAASSGDAAAAELVRLSQAAYATPPAVRYVLNVSDQPVTLPDGALVTTWTATVSSDGNGTWRSETSADPPGYSLYDGHRVAVYEGITRSWEIGPVENPAEGAFPMNGAFNWASTSYPKGASPTLDCANATSRGEVVIAGRTADRVWCPTLKMEYSLDRATHLVLRLAAYPGSEAFGWAYGSGNSPSISEVTSFEEITPDAATFDWRGPTIAERASGPIEGTKLVVGRRPPVWSGTTIAGKSFSTKSLTGPSAILFLCLDCTSGATAYDRFNEALAAHPGVRGVIVGQVAEVGTLTRFVEQHPTDAVVISDVNSDFPTAWGYPYLGGLVLLGSGGRVGDALSTRISADDYDRVFTAAEDDR